MFPRCGNTWKDLTRNRIERIFRDTSGYLAAAAGFAAGSDRALGGPVSCAIEPTNLCNLRCPLCASGAGLLERPKGCMSPEEFARIVSRLPRSVTTLFLWGQGEPFLAPGFLGMVRFAAGRGLRTITSTNGHFLDDPEEVVGSGLDTLIVSLDGADQETYASYRVGGDFRRVVDGVRGVVEAERSLGTGPEIRIQCVVNRRNEDGLDRLRALAKEIGARRIVFKTLQAASLPGGVELLPRGRVLNRYRTGECGVLETDRTFILRKRCFRLYHSFQVDWRGNVVPCCFDKDSEFVMGNLLYESSGGVWNSRPYRAFRNLLNREGRVHAMCRDCTEGLRRMNIYA